MNLASMLTHVSRWLLMIGIVAVVSTAAWGGITAQTVLLQLDPLNFQRIDISVLDSVRTESRILKDLIEDSYPKDAQGLARLLPQHWAVERHLPPEVEEKYGLLNKLTLDARSLSNLQREKFTLTLVRPEEASLRKALKSINEEWWPTGGQYLSIKLPSTWFLILSTVLLLTQYYLVSQYNRQESSIFPKILGGFYRYSLIGVVLFFISFIFLAGSMPLRLAFPAMVAGLFLSAIVFSSIRWPANRYSDFVRDLIYSKN